MHLFKKSLSLISFLGITVISNTAYADFPYNGEWWLNAGLGETTGRHDDVPLPADIPYYLYSSEKNDATDISGLSGELSLNFATANNQLLTIRGLTSSNDTCNIGCGEMEEFGLLYGLMAKARYGYVSASTGLSYVQAGYSGGTDFLGVHFNNIQHRTVGIPGEIQAFYTPFRYVGIGVVGFGDYNSHVPFGGAAIELQFGKLFGEN